MTVSTERLVTVKEAVGNPQRTALVGVRKS